MILVVQLSGAPATDLLNATFLRKRMGLDSGLQYILCSASFKCGYLHNAQGRSPHCEYDLHVRFVELQHRAW